MLAAATACIAGIQVVSTLLKEGAEVIDKCNADPNLRNQTLIELSDRNEKNFDESVKKLNQNRKDFEDLIEKKEKKTIERLSEQKKKMREQRKKRDEAAKEKEKHLAEMRYLESEFKEKMDQLKSENKEEREKAKLEYEEKVAKMEEEHSQKMVEVEIKMEKVKEEGVVKVEKAEKEMEEMREERRKKAQEFLDEQKIAEEEHLKAKDELKKIIRNLTLENQKKRREQIKEEDRRNIEHLKMNFTAILGYINIENTRRIVLKFQSIGAVFSNVRDSLESINALCTKITTAELLTLSVDSDTNNIHNQKAAYKFSVEQYQRLLLNRSTSDRRLLDNLFDLIKEMGKLMDDKEIVAICTGLPKAVKDSKERDVRDFGEKAGRCSRRFTGTNTQLENTIQKYLTEFAHNDTTKAELEKLQIKN
uniref:ANK_REP_REGION domain-containing protein n=1 Tax=Caenorhabditis tropicalis TaxID=1561998 RepID=A0A1I7TFG7_9PELO